MSENKAVEDLAEEDLEKLSDKQISSVVQINAKRKNKKAFTTMKKALEGKTDDIVNSLTLSPFVYTSDKVRIMAGLEVRFSTPIMAQVTDTSKEVDSFVRLENPVEARVYELLTRLTLAHALSELNGQDFGGVIFDADEYATLRKGEVGKAEEMIAEMRTERMKEIGGMSPVILDRVLAHYNAFQTIVEEIAGGDEAEESLGN